jgi:hypothetical protein
MHAALATFVRVQRLRIVPSTVERIARISRLV